MGQPTVKYEQVHAPSPKIRATPQGLQSTVRYKVAWADAFTFVNEAMGYEDGIPWKWPASPNMRATDASIDPVGVQSSPGKGGGSTPGTYYESAFVDVMFSSASAVLPMAGTADQPEANTFDPASPIEMSSFQIQYAAEAVKIPNGTLRWADKTNLGTDQIYPDSMWPPEAGSNYIRIPTFNLNVTLHNCLYVHSSNFADKIGKVNHDYMFGNCEPQTVLFDGVSTSRRQMSDGTTILDVTLNYKWRQKGWNVAMSNIGYLYQYSRMDGTLIYEPANINPEAIILPAQRWRRRKSLENRNA